MQIIPKTQVSHRYDQRQCQIFALQLKSFDNEKRMREKFQVD